MNFLLWLGVAALLAGLADTLMWMWKFGLRLPFQRLPFKTTMALLHVAASAVSSIALIALMLGFAS